jgi:hypothetical protein
MSGKNGDLLSVRDKLKCTNFCFGIINTKNPMLLNQAANVILPLRYQGFYQGFNKFSWIDVSLGKE